MIVMTSLKVAFLSGAVAFCATMAHAADLPVKALPPVEEFVSASGWYLRGDIGITNQQFHRLHQRLYDVPGTIVEPVGFGWDSASLFGLGVGYKFNNWFRGDITGEYRSRANFHGSDHVTFPGGEGVDNYSGSKSEWVVLANAYFDLGTWWCVTPYIGAGVGMANIRIDGFRDDGFNNFGISTAYAANSDKWNFAWAAHAGISYQVTPAMAIDLGYRYLSMGDGTTGATRAFDNSFTNGGPFTFRNINSHDLKLGVRWMLDAPVAPAPLMRRG
jgi:opacity protein-like surface antigen